MRIILPLITDDAFCAPARELGVSFCYRRFTPVKFALHMQVDQIHPKGDFQCGSAAREIARALEEAGVSAGFLSEHPAPSADWLHNDPAGHDTLDPLTALAFAAAATTHLNVLTNVLVLPYRNPFLTAKTAATLQVLSDNRLILGVGVGYQKAEFDALGARFAERGALTDEALETIRLAWNGGAVVKQGKGFNAVGNEPRPIPSPPPPIWIGGASDKAVERAARLGDGWMPHFIVPTNDPTVKRSSIVSLAHFAEKAKQLRELRDKLGKSAAFDFAVRPPFRFQTTTRSDADQFLQEVSELESYGVNWIWTRVPAPSRAAYLENVAWFGEEIIASFKA
jgi:probable F420-dependent oxidoreductase